MNEIKELLFKILEESPQIAIWVLVIIYGYKIVFVGSIFALLKFLMASICGTIQSIKEKNNELEEQKLKHERQLETAPKKWDIEGAIISDEKTKLELSALLNELKEEGAYIHSTHIARCRKAYRAALQKDKTT